MPKSPLVYLREQLMFQFSEWTALAEADKEWYKQVAIAEMAVLGIQ